MLKKVVLFVALFATLWIIITKVNLVKDDRAMKQEVTWQASQKEALLKSQLLATIEGARSFARKHNRLPRTNELSWVEMEIPAGQAGYIPGHGFENAYNVDSKPTQFSTTAMSPSDPLGEIHFQGTDEKQGHVVVWALKGNGQIMIYSYQLPLM